MSEQNAEPGFLRRAGSTLVGLFVGGLVNMGLIAAGGALLPPPPGVDVNDVASINARIGEYSVAQLLVPFFAHALGTLVGAWLAARLAGGRRGALVAAGIVGAFSLAGGIGAVLMIPAAPLWFDALDLLGAYLPMAWLGARLARTRS